MAFPFFSSAQSKSDPVSIRSASAAGTFSEVVINEVVVLGNKKTQPHIILRELDFHEGDTLRPAVLADRLAKAEQQVYNLGLFNSVEITQQPLGGKQIVVRIRVKERWYYFPVPLFVLNSKNYNTWWVKENKDLSKINYGIKFTIDNFRGRNEEIVIRLSHGYRQEAEVEYEIPGINRKGTLGLSAIARYNRGRKMPYESVDNKLLELKDSRNVYRVYQGGLIGRWRPALRNKHYFGLLYFNTGIADTLARLNRDFLLNEEDDQQFFHLVYRFESDHRDFEVYPLNGYYWSMQLDKLGLGLFGDLNIGNVEGYWSGFKSLGKQFYLSGQAKVKLSLPLKQPFYNQEALTREEDYVRGFEYYNINGQNLGIMKLNLKRRLLAINTGQWFKSERLQDLAMAAYLKTFLDIGYVNDRYYAKDDPLSNTFLIGWGIGLDVPFFYDQLLRLEYSFNRTNDREVGHGFFVHFTLDVNNRFRTPRLP